MFYAYWLLIKKAKVYKLLQTKISFFHKFWNCAPVAAFDVTPFL